MCFITEAGVTNSRAAALEKLPLSATWRNTRKGWLNMEIPPFRFSFW